MATARVVVTGCDDRTELMIDVSEAELDFLLSLAEGITERSQFDCQPTMTVEVLP